MVKMNHKTKTTLILISLLLISDIAIFTTQKSEQITIVEKALKKQEDILIVDKKTYGDYTTIQEAINDAQKNQIIIIKNGTYQEILNIRKTVKLVGEENTVINPISEKNKYAIRLGAPNIEIKNLTIRNGAPGIYATALRISSSKNTIKNCNFSDTPIGIALWTSKNIIENCNFKNCKDEGIALLGSKFTQCQNNTIKNCNFENNCDGIELQYSSKNKIINCNIFNNTHSGIDAIASSNNENLFKNCRIYNNRVHGIYLSSSNNNTIENCQIYNNKDGNTHVRGDSENNKIITTEIFSKNTILSSLKENNIMKTFFTRCFSALFSLILKKNY